MDYRGFNIKIDGTFGMYQIKHRGRGTLATALRGSYTKTSEAMKTIDNYLKAKGDTNDGEEEQCDRS